MHSQLSKPLIATALSATLCFSATAVAAPESSELDVITVTATKRQVLLTDLPQSIQAITAEKLATEGVVSMSDIVQVVPGASQTFKASPGFEVLQLRGISSGAVGDSLVGYYIDEIPFGLPNVQYIPPVNVFDLERVEVLRGPQGTLYGQSTMGGAIRLITRKPDLESFGGEVRAGFGHVAGGFDGYKGDVMLNAPLKSGVAGIRLTGGTSEEDGFIEDTGTIRNHNLRLKGLLKASDSLSVEATLWAIRSRQVDYAYGQPANPYQSITDPNEPRGVDTDMNLANLTFNYASSIGDFVSASSYVDHKFDYVFALPGLRDLFPGAGQWLSDNTVATEVFSQELRLASREDSAIGWIGGVFFQDAKLRGTQAQGWANYAPFNLGPTVYTAGEATLKTQSIGVFGEISGKWLDGKLVPTLGLRYYRDERDADDLRDGVAGSASRSFNSLNPRFNLAFKPADGSLYYLNVAKGFRSGAQQSQAAVAAATAAGLPASVIMPQDELWSYEVGAKWSIGSRVAIEAAVYVIDWSDAQLTNLLVGANNVTTTIISGGNDVRGHGIDIGVNWATPIEGLTLQFAGNINSTEFSRVPPNTIAQEDAQIPGSPKNSASIAANYRTQLGTLDFTTNLSLNFRGKQTELTTGSESDSIRDLRLRIGVGQESWDASVYATNLTDQRGVAAVLSALVVNPIQPRKIGVDVNFRF